MQVSLPAQSTEQALQLSWVRIPYREHSKPSPLEVLQGQLQQCCAAYDGACFVPVTKSRVESVTVVNTGSKRKRKSSTKMIQICGLHTVFDLTETISTQTNLKFSIALVSNNTLSTTSQNKERHNIL